MFTHLTDQQPIADDLKRLIQTDAISSAATRQGALLAVSRFERQPWQPLAFEEAADLDVAAAPSGKLTQMNVRAPGAEGVLRILERYTEMVAPVDRVQLYDLREAADYLGLSEQGVKYHVYQTKLLQGEVKGGAMIFTQQQLDRFLKVKPAKRGPQKQS